MAELKPQRGVHDPRSTPPVDDPSDRYDDDPLAELARIVTESAMPSAQPQPQHFDEDEPTVMMPSRSSRPMSSDPYREAAEPVTRGPAKTAADIEADLLADLRQSIMPSLSAAHGSRTQQVQPAQRPPVAHVSHDDDEIDDGPTIPLSSLRGRMPQPTLDDAFDDLFADNPLSSTQEQDEPRAGYRAGMTPPTADPTLPTFEGLTREDITRAANEGRPRLKPKPMPRHPQSERRAVRQSTRSSARGLKIAALLLGTVVMGGLGFLGWRAFATGSEPALPPVIKADTKPIKMKPDTSTVVLADPTTKLSADKVEEQTKLVTRQEEPVDMVGPTGVRRIPPATSGSQMSVNGEPARQVKTVVVRPDGTMEQQFATPPATPVRTTSVTPGDAAPISPPAATQPPKLPPVPVPSTANSTAPRSPLPAAVPVAPAPVPPKTTAAALPPPAGSVPPTLARPSAPAATGGPMTLGPSGQPQSPQPVPPRMASAPEPLPPAAAPSAPVASGDYVVQLSAQGSEADARRAFSQAQSRYPALAGRSLDIQRADLGAKGVFYRVRVTGGSPGAGCVAVQPDQAERRRLPRR